MVDRRIQPKTRSAKAACRVVRRRVLATAIAAVVFGNTPLSNRSVFADMPIQIPGSAGERADLGTVHSNPFTPSSSKSAASRFEMSAVRLASGDRSSSIPTMQLKPIGIAVGLHSIEEDAMPRAVRPALTVRSAPASRVQLNQHLGSAHHAGRELHDARITAMPKVSRRVLHSTPPPVQGSQSRNDDYYQQPATFAHSAARQSHLITGTSAESGEVIQQAAGEIVEPAEPIMFSMSDDSESASSPVADAVDPAMPATAAPAKVMPPVAPGAVAEAFEFSLSDDVSTAEPTTISKDQSDADVEEPAPAIAKAAELAEPQTAAVIPDEGSVMIAQEFRFEEEPETKISAVEPMVIEGEVTVETPHDEHIAAEELPLPVQPEAEPSVDVSQGFADLLAPIVMSEAKDEGDLSEEVIPSTSGDVLERSVVIRGSDEHPADKLRPPVAVEAPPASFQTASARSTSGIVHSAIDPSRSVPKQSKEQTLHWKPTAVASNLPAPIRTDQSAAEMPLAKQQPAPAVATPLYMTRAQVRSLTIRGHLHKVSVSDRSVCQAVAAGTSQIKLIGTGNGVTELVVWASLERDQPAISRAFQIHVTDSVEASSDPASEKMAVLSQSIRHAFPNSDVTIQLLTDKLVVSGRCPSEDAAKKVIRMVRKTCLVPVIDELSVR